jgi:L-2-hydroxyglutarate oxidase LhgO
VLLLVEDAPGGPPAALHARSVVLCAGLATRALARSFCGVDADALPRQHLAKGNYFALRGVPTPFSRLVYPLPQDGGLGVHATLDLAGRVRFGPDVEWLPSPAHGDAASPADELAALAALNFRVDPARAAAFQAAVRPYWPALPDGALVPDYSGIRPKVRALASLYISDAVL